MVVLQDNLGVKVTTPFVYHFDEFLARDTDEQSFDPERFKGLPLLPDLIEEAQAVIRDVEPFTALPERNQQLLLDMADFMITKANRRDNRHAENIWGLYIVGSRAGDQARPDSDLDLLSVGSFFQDQGFIDRFREQAAAPGQEPILTGVWRDFDLEIPEKLPDQYNVGAVDRKYLIRATPQAEGVLPVDLSVVDLTFSGPSTLARFKKTMDVDKDGSPLVRLPLVELTVEADRPVALHL